MHYGVFADLHCVPMNVGFINCARFDGMGTSYPRGLVYNLVESFITKSLHQKDTGFSL